VSRWCILKTESLHEASHFILSFQCLKFPPLLSVGMANTKRCTRCNELKELGCFVKALSSKDHLHYWCKVCKSTVEKDRYRTTEGFLKSIARSCERVDNNKGRIMHDGGVQVSYDFLAAADPVCQLSGHPLTRAPFSDWQFTVDRMDQSRRHTTDNIRISALEIQNSNPWTPEKFQYFITGPHDAALTSEEIDALLPATPARRNPEKFITRDEDGWVECHGCRLYCSRESFQTRGSAIISDCSTCRRAKADTFKCILRSLFADATRRGKDVARKQCTMTLSDLHCMFRRQSGLCAYSHLRLRAAKGDWRVSLERRNSALGYTAANCCLVVQELNGIDRSAMIDGGGGGWSEQKVAYIRAFYARNNAK
jgi:hypothetical protein